MAALTLLSCGDATGTGRSPRFAHGMSFLAQFPAPFASVTAGAGAIVAFDRVIVEFRRAANERSSEVALRSIVEFGAATDSMQLTMSVPLSPDAPSSGEMLALYLFYLNAAGDTVFAGGPVAVLAAATNRGDTPPAPMLVPLMYTGPGADASTVRLLPDTLTVAVGQPFAFVASAFDTQQGMVADAPIIYSSLDTALATLTSPVAGSGTALGAPGVARIRAQLVTSSAADTALLMITPAAGGTDPLPTGTAAVDITTDNVSLNGSFGDTVNVRLVSDGSPTVAPAGGVTLTLSAVDTGCAATPASVTIAEGLSSTTFPVTYGGSTLLPCTTRLRATGPAGFGSDSTVASVGPVPAINLAATRPVASGHQVPMTGLLGATNHGATTLRLTSLDSSRVLLATNDATPGAGLIDIPIAAGQQTIGFVVSAVEGLVNDSARFVASVPGFITDTVSVPVWQPVYDLRGVPLVMTSYDADVSLHVRVGTPNSPTGTSIFYPTRVRVGGVPTPASIINESPNAGTLVTGAGTADSVEMLVPIGDDNTPVSLADGGVSLRPLAPGSIALRAFVAGHRALPAAWDTATVQAPQLSQPSLTLGSGLQRSIQVTLDGPAPAGGQQVTISAQTPGVLLFSSSPDAIGADRLVGTIPEGGRVLPIYVQALESFIDTTVIVISNGPNVIDGESTVRVIQPVFAIDGLLLTGTLGDQDDPFWVRVGTPLDATADGITWNDSVRAGANPLTVQVVNDGANFGDLITSSQVADSLEVQIQPGQNRSPTSVGSLGVALRYTGIGSLAVRSFIRGLRGLSTASRTVTIAQPAIMLNDIAIGWGLQKVVGVSLSADAPPGGLALTFTADSSLRFAPNTTTAGHEPDGLLRSTIARVHDALGHDPGRAGRGLRRGNHDRSALAMTVPTGHLAFRIGTHAATGSR